MNADDLATEGFLPGVFFWPGRLAHPLPFLSRKPSFPLARIQE